MGLTTAFTKRIGKRFLQFAGPVLTVAVLSLAIVVLHRMLRNYHYRDVVAAVRQLSAGQAWLALLFTVLSYIFLTLYDTLGLRHIAHPLPYRKIAVASFIGYAFNNNLGFAGLAGNSLRYRLYSSWGLSPLEVARVITFCIVSFWLGFLAVAGSLFLLDPMPVPTGIPFPSVRIVGALFLLPVVAYLAWALYREKRIRIGPVRFSPPPLRISLTQLLLAAGDWALAASVLFWLLPGTGQVSFGVFAGLFLLAQVVSLVSHVPGGLGVFEAVMLLMLTPPHSTLAQPFTQPEVFGAILAFRVIYYFIPLVAAALVLGAHELRLRSSKVQALSSYVRSVFQRPVRIPAGARALAVPKETLSFLEEWSPAFVPNVFALAIFLAGAVLLFSGATPAAADRIEVLHSFLPREITIAAHLLASMLGVALLLIANGLYRRLDAAYLVSVALLASGIPLSLIKGIDYEEALVLLVVLLALLPCRSHFYRRTALLERFSVPPAWALAIGLTITSSIWLGFFSFRHLRHPDQFWAQMSRHGDASRFLWASVAAVGVVGLFGLRLLLQPAPRRRMRVDPEDLDLVRSIVSGSPATYARLALLGDKEFLFSAHRNGFIMYGVEGRSWITMGDAIGPKAELEELTWQFRELCDAHGGWPAYYQVSAEQLPLYVDLGLMLIKLGEEAMVPLGAFTIDGQRRKPLRHTYNRIVRQGYRFEIVPGGVLDPLLPRLKAVSDAWLTTRNNREKGFSLGYFNEAYLRENPVALVRDEHGEIVAFANLWQGAGRHELSIDMMRYIPDMRTGLIDYLMVELMLWGKGEGWTWFNLGMAPLSGLEGRSLAPLWARAGSIIFSRGESFHHLQGLRQYKEKFDPTWVPRYLACPGGVALPLVITNIATLIARGMRGFLAK